MTKIEAKHFLESVYDLKIENINSLVRTKLHQNVFKVKLKNKKRFYVELTSPVWMPNVPKPVESIVDRPLLKR